MNRISLDRKLENTDDYRQSRSAFRFYKNQKSDHDDRYIYKYIKYTVVKDIVYKALRIFWYLLK